jgi:hypothetical protein
VAVVVAVTVEEEAATVVAVDITGVEVATTEAVVVPGMAHIVPFRLVLEAES